MTEFLVVLWGVLASSLASGAASASVQEEAARGVLARLVGNRVEEFTLSVIDPDEDRDVYEVSASEGRVRVRGSSGVALARGAHDYLRQACGVHVSWDGNRVDLPDTFPDFPETRVACPHQFVHYFNVCTFGYTTVWWDWDRWEREIDWMALHGINMPLALNGQEAIWQRVYESFGLDREDLDDFFSGPAYLPWNRLGCLNAQEGPLPQAWIDGQAELQKRILDRQRALGMTPVTQAFAGFVPPAFARAHPELDILETSGWAGFPPTLLLNPNEPMFVEIGRRFIEAHNREYGTDHLYLSDSFIEMKPPFEEDTRLEDLASIGHAVYRGISEADADGVWVMMGWPFLFYPDVWGEEGVHALFSRVPQDKVMLLDLAVEITPVWRKHEAFRERPWLSCIIHNFGQQTTIYGDLPLFSELQQSILASPDRGRHVGAGITPEGIEQNSVVYKLLTDAIWSRDPIDLPGWLDDYSVSRYGACPPEMARAWEALVDTVYGMGIQEAVPFLSCMVLTPDLSYRPGEDFDYRRLGDGVRLFLSCAPQLGHGDLYRRDLVDLAKQYIAMAGRHFVARISEADVGGETNRRDELIKQYMEAFDDLDGLVGTRPEYHVSQWIDAARRLATDSREADLYERNARRLVTRWGNHGNVNDYAAREWSGMLRGYYDERWRIFFDALIAAEPGEFDPEETGRKVAEWEEEWVRCTEPVPGAEPGNEIAVVREMMEKYGDWPDRLVAARGDANGQDPGDRALWEAHRDDE